MVNHRWLLTGLGPRYLVASDAPGEIVPGEYERPVQQVAPTTVAEHQAAIEALVPGLKTLIMDETVLAYLRGIKVVVNVEEHASGPLVLNALSRPDATAPAQPQAA